MSRPRRQPHDAGAVEDGGVERNGIHEVAFATSHHEDCRAAVERIATPYTRRSTATCSTGSARPLERGQRQGLDHQRTLRQQEEAALAARLASAPARRRETAWGRLERADTPSLKGEPVSSRTTHACPTLCIHVPMSETSCPDQRAEVAMAEGAEPGDQASSILCHEYHCWWR